MDSSMLKEATSSDDSPTPGFVLNEISRATIASYQACTVLQDFLLSRLTRNNHNTKLKCLVIIKHVCRAGRADFKREMSRNVEPIKACLQYTGPADPLRGDDIYRKVREAAKEALSVIFDSQIPITTSAVSASNRIQGIGGGDVPATTNNYLNTDISSFRLSAMGSIDSSNSYHSKNESSSSGSSSSNNRVGYSSSYNGTYSSGNGNYNQGASSSSGKMEGFGNPNFNNDFSNISSGDISTDWIKAASKTVISASKNISATIRTVANQITNESDVDYRINSNYTNNMPSTNVYGKSFSNNNNNNNNNNSVSISYSHQSTLTNYSIQNGYNINNNTSNVPIGYNINTNINNNNIVPDIPQQIMGMGRAGGATSDGTYEKQLLESLCDSGGLKNTLNEEKLKSFLAIASTLNIEVVGLCLLELLNQYVWQMRYKALIVIANLCQSNNRNSEISFSSFSSSSTSSNQYLEWWLNHTDDVKGLLSDSKTSVRTQAIQTLKKLNIEDYSSSDNQQQHKNRQPNIFNTSVMSSTNTTEFNFIPYNNDEINLHSQPSVTTIQTTQPSTVTTPTAVSLIDFDDDSPVTSISVNPITVSTISNNNSTKVVQSDDDTTTLFSGMILNDNNSNSSFSNNTLEIITPSHARISSSSPLPNNAIAVDILNQQNTAHENSDDFSSLASIVNDEITTVNATNLPNNSPPIYLPIITSIPIASNAYESSADTIVKDGVDFLSSKTQINSAPSSSSSSSSHQPILNQLSPQQYPSYHQQQPALFMHTNPPILSAPYYSTGGGGIAVLPTNMKYYQPRPYLLSSQSPSSPQGLPYSNGTAIMANMNMSVPPQIFNSSVMHSTDLSKRKIIQDINSAESSGFSFLGQQSQNKTNDDSFKFIADEIKQTANNTNSTSTNSANKK